MIICVDFDETIVYSKYPEIAGIKPKAKEVINRLYEEGNEIIIWTCRMDKALDIAKDFIREMEISHHQINEHMPRLIEKYGNDTRKVYADVYIDDKNLGGIPDDWEEIYNILKQHPLYGIQD
jgi:hypothetical protein